MHFFEVQVAGQHRQGKDIVIKAQLCTLKETATGELALVSSDSLHDLAPCLESLPALAIQPPTPQEQQQVEDWLKVKVQFPLIKQEQQNRQRELQIRQDNLKLALESKIREEQSKQMKLAAKVAAGDETYRVASSDTLGYPRHIFSEK
ncbi:hypothetical protein NUACC21_68450 [Scytonema sp. NUACC21]